MRLVRMVPGSARNWIAVNTVDKSSLNKEMKMKKMTVPFVTNSRNLASSAVISPRVSLKLLTALVSAWFCLQVSAATLTITNTNDSGVGSLRDALAGASDGDTINFSVTGTITLTSGQ